MSLKKKRTKFSLKGGNTYTTDYFNGWLELQGFMLLNKNIISIDMYDDEFKKLTNDDCEKKTKDECQKESECKYSGDNNMCANKNRFKELEEKTTLYGKKGYKFVVLKKFEYRYNSINFTFTCVFFLRETNNVIYVSFNVYDGDGILNFIGLPGIEIFFKAIINELINQRDNNTNIKIILCGHSLGCSLSLYLYYLIKQNETFNNICVFVSGQYNWIPESESKLIEFYNKEHKNIFVFIYSKQLYKEVIVDGYVNEVPTIPVTKDTRFFKYEDLIYICLLYKKVSFETTNKSDKNIFLIINSIDNFSKNIDNFSDDEKIVIIYVDNLNFWYRYKYVLEKILIQIDSLNHVNNGPESPLVTNQLNDWQKSELEKYGKKMSDSELFIE